MKLANFMAGVQILLPYYDKPDGYHLGAEHDEIFLYATERPVSKEDIAKLIELDWFQQEHEGDEFTVDSYNQEEAWSAYV